MNPRLYFYFLLLIPSFCYSQNEYGQMQMAIFRQSCDQQICREIQKENPGHFDCSKSKSTWTIPTATDITIFGQSIQLTTSEKELFTSIIFPEGNCQQYLVLVSLCDLYFPLFRKKIESKGLHADYIYLPLLLSGCNQNYSGTNENAGLWAMDFLAARKSHLRLDTLVDERRGGDFSTEAALSYLSELSLKYQGDAFRTITAYRLGVPYVNSMDMQKGDESFYQNLDENSRAFFKLYAFVAELIKSTRTDNQLNHYFDILGQYESVNFERTVQLDALVSVLQVTKNELRDSNPVYTGNYVVPGFQKVPFVLNRVASLKFEVLHDSVYNWKAPVAEIAVAVAFEDQIIIHKVKRGESLGKIAAKYKVTIQQIKKWNQLKSDRISKGQKLKIHRSKPVTQVAEPLTETPDLMPKPISVTIENTPEPLVKTDSIELQNQFVALISKGDVCKDKKKWDCSKLNYTKALALFPGDEPTIEKLEYVKKQLASQKTEAKKVIYTVKNGDSLWTIARKYKGVSEQDIMKWNKCNENIRPGQKLKIFLK